MDSNLEVVTQALNHFETYTGRYNDYYKVWEGKFEPMIREQDKKGDPLAKKFVDAMPGFAEKYKVVYKGYPLQRDRDAVKSYASAIYDFQRYAYPMQAAKQIDPNDIRNLLEIPKNAESISRLLEKIGPAYKEAFKSVELAKDWMRKLGVYETAVLIVKVQDEDNGSPIVGAEVTIRGDSYSKKEFTDAKGNARFGTVLEGKYAINAKSHGFSDKASSMNIAPSANPQFSCDIKLGRIDDRVAVGKKDKKEEPKKPDKSQSNPPPEKPKAILTLENFFLKLPDELPNSPTGKKWNLVMGPNSKSIGVGFSDDFPDEWMGKISKRKISNPAEWPEVAYQSFVVSPDKTKWNAAKEQFDNDSPIGGDRWNGVSIILLKYNDDNAAKESLKKLISDRRPRGEAYTENRWTYERTEMGFTRMGNYIIYLRVEGFFPIFHGDYHLYSDIIDIIRKKQNYKE